MFDTDKLRIPTYTVNVNSSKMREEGAPSSLYFIQNGIRLIFTAVAVVVAVKASLWYDVDD